MTTEQATKARIKQGIFTTELAIDAIRNSDDGLTVYELSKKIGMSPGSCLNAIKRSKENLSVTEESNGIRLRKRYRVVNT